MEAAFIVFAVLVALWGSFKFGQADATVKFDAQGRRRVGR